MSGSRLTSVAALFFVVSCLLAGAAAPRTWRVRTDGSGDAQTIEAAIDSASAGDTVLVGPGTYVENTLYIRTDLHLVGEMGPDLTVIERATSYQIENAPVLWLDSLGTNSSVSGFTIARGKAWPTTAGGGVVMSYCSSILENNIIRDNYGCNDAGSIMCYGGGPVIRSNVIYRNAGYAGCIFVAFSSATIESNTIAYNIGDFYPPRPAMVGGGIRIYRSSCVVSHNIIVHNQADAGGGIFCDDAQSAASTFSCNLVYGNEGGNCGGSLADQTGANGNISVDPEFCAAHPDSTGNFFLQSDSPCLPGPGAGGVWTLVPCGLIGARPQGCGSTGTESATWGAIKSIFAR
jgi:hypothetical protein